MLTGMKCCYRTMIKNHIMDKWYFEKEMQMNVDKSNETAAYNNSLADILSVDIDRSMPQDAKIQDFIQKIGNPYCFKCRDTVVTVRFSDTEYTFEDGVIQYLKNKML
jgi:hypothetical protein